MSRNQNGKRLKAYLRKIYKNDTNKWIYSWKVEGPQSGEMSGDLSFFSFAINQLLNISFIYSAHSA